MNSLKDECHRLRNTIVNKDSQNESLQKLLDKEKERRKAEAGELRRLLQQESDKAVRAIREAEANLTNLRLFTLPKMQQSRTLPIK